MLHPSPPPGGEGLYILFPMVQQVEMHDELLELGLIKRVVGNAYARSAEEHNAR